MARSDVRTSDHASSGVLISVTDHALERFCQRVARRRGELDARAEIASRVAEAWAAGRVEDRPPNQPADRASRRGRRYVRDLSDRELLYVCAHDARRSELTVITLWEQERLTPARVPKRFTDALRTHGR